MRYRFNSHTTLSSLTSAFIQPVVPWKNTVFPGIDFLSAYVSFT